MSLANVHTAGFTRLPKRAFKEWKKMTYTTNTLTPSDPHSRHRETTVSSIAIMIDFDTVDMYSERVFSRYDDVSDDAIELWRENRQLWTDIEKAVEDVISGFGMKVRMSAEEKKLQSFEAPMVGTTKYEYHDEFSPRLSRSSESIPRPPDTVIGPSYARTLLPDDSISAVNTDVIKRLIEEEIERRKKAKSKKPKSKRQPSIFEYLAT